MWGAPSRASLLTGRYPFRIGVYQNADIDAGGVPSNFTFLPELLRRDGFATPVVGKWHVGWRTPEMTPTWRGFDSFLGYWHCCNDYYTHHFPDAVPNVTTAPTAPAVFVTHDWWRRQRGFITICNWLSDPDNT